MGVVTLCSKSFCCWALLQFQTPTKDRKWILSSLIWCNPCYKRVLMGNSSTTLLTREPAKARGAGAPTPRAAMALAKSKAYQDAADAPATLKAYATG